MKPSAGELFDIDLGPCRARKWEDSEFLKANGAKGVTIEISDGDTKTADLQVIQLNSKTSQAE
jgi:hypothetical protein